MSSLRPFHIFFPAICTRTADQNVASPTDTAQHRAISSAQVATGIIKSQVAPCASVVAASAARGAEPLYEIPCTCFSRPASSTGHDTRAVRRGCCCSHINSHSQVRGHWSGIPQEKKHKSKVVHAYDTKADAIHASARKI